jgi:phosphatidate cytidylyltransferase
MQNGRGVLADYKVILKRVVTAVVLIPIVVFGIFYLSDAAFSLAVAIILSLAAWEWSRLVGLIKIWQRILYLGFLWWGFSIAQLLGVHTVLWFSAIWWVIVVIIILRYPHINQKIFQGWKGCLISFLVFIPCFLGFNVLHRMGGVYVILSLCIIWAADTGAYFSGILWGKHKLAPAVSPKKTVEGLIGGIFLAIITVLVFILFRKVEFNKWLLWTFLVVLNVFFSVLGDLFESVVKRQANVKDSGNWLPGHGGVLDRIDSITAAVPIFALELLVFARFL